jgi:hypothetical protein
MNPPLQYERGYKYQVYADYGIQTAIKGYDVHEDFFSLDKSGWIIVKRGYAWDGASGPTIDTKSSMVSSLVHDVFYQLLREGHLPHDPCFHIANEELRRLCENDGMWRWRATMWFDFVEQFGTAFAAVQPDKVFTAP